MMHILTAMYVGFFSSFFSAAEAKAMKHTPHTRTAMIPALHLLNITTPPIMFFMPLCNFLY
jgi:hypothetical protein